MTLGERIALARKQAGLSQEQLGDKLGVSRQAVSKWESDQTNPDVAYVAQMCRLLGVSSDWLLLGEESAQSAAPERCPGCQAIVSGLDQFCPNCGRSLRGNQPKGYTILLKARNSGDSLAREDLFRLSKTGIFSKPPLDGSLDYQKAQELVSSAPVVLGTGLDKEEVYRAWDVLSYPSCFLFFEDTEQTDPQILAEYPGIDPKSLILTPRNEPMTFGMTVLAVIAGIIGAVILLSFL
ncbi:helix-turn-helix domain-containing protein [Colidextribacter sp. OB.20]|uniref:helix-turn-helix domain-containing protein n=1 Tax=Colidextribacter sp. OB.20 TaxID=2304568 RepID=UPI00136BE154|nr:helix-turn-helix domain-containing protein [Colidextribacter sp. OB.20]NBI08478.1 helix-turn-helix domain-containing protein [Colidextribacter sp. OB.20]